MSLSASTISRALNDMPGVGRKRAEEIKAAAERYGYSPNPYHRSRSSSLALVFPENLCDEQFSRRQIFFAERYAAAENKYLFVSFIPHNARELPALLQDNRVDGVLLAGHPDREFVDLIRQKDLPMVGINDLSSRLLCDCVIANPVTGALELIRKLLDSGRSRFGFVITDRQYPSVNRRFSALEMVLRERGMSPTIVLDSIESSLRGGREAVERILRSSRRPDVLIFTNDWLALGGMHELSRQGICVPQEISVAAFDNTSICEELSPRLTSVDLHTEEVVQAAINRLTTLIDKDDRGIPGYAQIEISSSLIWRDSCS